MTPEAAFAQAMALWQGDKLGLAVSGGSDSMALLHLAQDWATTTGVALQVASVDHHLRPTSAAEAAAVAAACQSLSLPHATLHWHGWTGHGNLQDAAREARLGLLADWAQATECSAVALGHTRDDQAETLLLRLARGSGVEGLAAMAARDHHHGAMWLRPLLGVGRHELRAYLRARGVAWMDDPSNDNPAFDRVKARHALAALAPLGIDADGLAATAARLRGARDSLDWAARQAARHVARLDHGDVVLDLAALSQLPPDMEHRLVAQALCRVGGQPYRPRLDSLRAAMALDKATLHGCVLMRARGVLRITREYNAVASCISSLGDLWDGRWQIIPPAGASVPPDAEIRALGEQGLSQCPEWRETGLPRPSLLASPAIWSGARLIAAPLAGLCAQWQAIYCHEREDFFSALPAH
jgi:tRNA(Ile)-lysidine synthase